MTRVNHAVKSLVTLLEPVTSKIRARFDSNTTSHEIDRDLDVRVDRDALNGRSRDEAIRHNRDLVAGWYLHGEGIEIGALHNPLVVPPTARVRYVDRMTETELRSQYAELASYNLVDVDIVDDGTLLRTVNEASQDFVIANHFLEHCPNTIEAIENMLRVLKTNGILYLAIPDKLHTFDIDRPVTTIDHLLKDYEEGHEWSRRADFEEWTRLVNKTREELVAEETDRLMEMDYSIHYHVWTQAEMLELMVTLQKRLRFPFSLEFLLRNGHEVIFILRKTEGRA
jgi:predicted SAM-dependent methyltransferase